MVPVRAAHEPHRPAPDGPGRTPGARARPRPGRTPHRTHPRQPAAPRPTHRGTGRSARPRITPDLHEWNYGAYEGVTTVEIRVTRPGWNLWTDGVALGPGANPGEDPAQVGARADRVLAEVRAAASRLGDTDIVLVAHSHFLRVLVARYLGLTTASGALFQLATGAVSRLGTEHGKPVVTALNVALPESLYGVACA